MSTRASSRVKLDSTSEEVGVSMGLADVESVVAKAVKAAVTVVREEFNKLYKDLKDYCESLEHRIEVLENRPAPDTTDIDATSLSATLTAMKEDNRRTALAANDTEQYGRRYNLRFKGLQFGSNDDCQKVLTDFISTKLQVHVRDGDIEMAHPLPVRRAHLQSPQSSQLSSGTSVRQDSIVIARFYDKSVRDRVIRQRKLLKNTGYTIVEDLTSLNVEVLNRLRRDSDVDKCWSWNGHIYALLKNGRKVRVRPFQSLHECDN